MPLRATMCKTCPFRPGSKYAYLAPDLGRSAVTESNRECHSTGSNAIHSRTGIEPHVCRGAREVQLTAFAASGIIEAATDEAWNKMRVKCGMEPEKIGDPAPYRVRVRPARDNKKPSQAI